jgi:hypothetical protein
MKRQNVVITSGTEREQKESLVLVGKLQRMFDP